MELGRWMGSLHPALIHFPLVLLPLAVVLDLADLLRPNPRLAWASRLLLVPGMGLTLVAFVCGNFAELWAARSGIDQEALEQHEFLATVAAWAFMALTVWRILQRDAASRAARAVWAGAGAAASLLLVLAARHGGKLVYGHGAGVRSIPPLRPPTHDGLAALLQRQDAASIAYSDLMHHAFGWVVLALAALLAMDQVAPALAARLRRLGPLLFLAGGAALMVFSDQDAWPLFRVRPVRPITDKEVLLHKALALMMIAVGVRGLWLTCRRGAPAARKVNDRLVAAFALLGGALLFTHIHSAAPYANVAVGVYLHHTVLGIVALIVGGVKLWDDAARKPSRLRTAAFPALIALEAFFLIRYNEGLPWFLGYGNLLASPTRGGLAAPLGPHRAELVYRSDTGQLELFVTERGSPNPRPLPVDDIQVVVRVGDESTSLDLRGNPAGPGPHAHFAGPATFLRHAAMFQAQARARFDGREHVADFEPWVDPAMSARPPAGWTYLCPMHPAVGGPRPGRCPRCQMPLQPNRPPRPPGVLHDPGFSMELACAPARPVARQPALLRFTPRAGRTVAKLEVVHMAPLHLIVVSEDLSFFDHQHPRPAAGGAFEMSYAFPRGGRFVLYADVTPVGEANQVFRIPLEVDGPAPPREALRESPAEANYAQGLRVALAAAPLPLRAADEAVLEFALSENGLPVTDLEPYLGASGHCVILSEDTDQYLHSHPLEDPAPRNGPRIRFHTRFPRPGLYKVWAQFQRRGRVLTTAFVVRVASPRRFRL